MSTSTLNPNLLPPGPHPALASSNPNPEYFRCKLRPETNKKDPAHADYSGVLQLDGSTLPTLGARRRFSRIALWNAEM